ncbi:MAG: hypothetical protein RugAbin2_02409 [Rugosibacter sp.]|nr:hypothetical protein [Rugosibacter sp.]
MKILNPNFAPPSRVTPALKAAIQAAAAAAAPGAQFIDLVALRALPALAAVDTQDGTIHQAALDLGLKVVTSDT